MAAGTLRVIPRLDIKGPNVVKGIQFDGFRVLGPPEYFAERYYQDGADELIFQDTVASLYRRNSVIPIVKKTAERVFIPITVAGGLRTVDDIREILRAGADKVAINTAAVEHPELITRAVQMFGSQCIVSSIEVHRTGPGKYELWTDYGRQVTGIDAFEWAQRVVELGVGEIMLTSIDREGTGRGYDLELVRKFAAALPVPVIACGGAGSPADLVRAAREGEADAVSAASIFHYHYAKRMESAELAERYGLRMGAHEDTGNYDFIHSGYGGYQAIPVKPASLLDAKRALAAAGVRTRTLGLGTGGAANG